MLVNFKRVLKTSPLLNNNNNNGLNLPITRDSETKRHFYRFMPYPTKTHRNVNTYDSTVSSNQLSMLCQHGMNVFLYGLNHAITTILEHGDTTANYRFISKVKNHSHISLFVFSHHIVAYIYRSILLYCKTNKMYCIVHTHYLILI